MEKQAPAPMSDVSLLSLERLPSLVEKHAGVRFTDPPVFGGYVGAAESVKIFISGDRIANALNAQAAKIGFGSSGYQPIEQGLKIWQNKQLSCHEHSGGESRFYVISENVQPHANRVYDRLSRDGLLPATDEGRHGALHLVEWIAVARELAKDIVSDAVEDSIANETVNVYRLWGTQTGRDSRELVFLWLATRKGLADWIARKTCEDEGALPQADAALDVLYSHGAFSSPELTLLYRTVHRRESANADLRFVGDGFMRGLANAVGNPANFTYTHELPDTFYAVENPSVHARNAKPLKPFSHVPRASDE